MNLDDLAKPFPAHAVHWRVGSTNKDKTSGMALAYIDARDVENRFDEVCGPTGWQCDFPWSDGKKLVCRIGVKVGDEWIWKSNGAGDTDVEGDKGAFSDAFKRAAVKWGVGRHLYSCPNWWEPIEAAGRSYKFSDAAIASLNRKFSAWLGGSSVPASAQPSEQASSQGASADDDKPWYNDFDQHKGVMLAKIASGESTAQDIVTNLRKKYKVSKQTAEKINSLASSQTAH